MNNQKVITDDIFTAFDLGNELIITERKLPHWKQKCVTYFITFRLADSIPIKKLNEIKSKRAKWEELHTKPYSDDEWAEYVKIYSEKIQGYLDMGIGSCVLRNNENSKIVADALKYFDQEKYILDEWVVMPNHIHVIITPINGVDISKIVHSWKSFSALEINKNINNSGSLWLKERHDHIIRNKKQLRVIRKYILENPKKADIKVHDISSGELYKNMPGSSGVK